MKTIFFFIVSSLVLFSCQKNNVQQDEVNNVGNIVFNLDVRYHDDTKAVKSSWETGDKLFIFFSGVSTGYFTSVYDGTAFSNAKLNGIVTIDDLASSGTLTAIYLPYVGDAEPVFGTAWTFPENNESYYLMAQKKSYTLSKVDGIATLSATLNMYGMDRYVQVFIPAGGTVMYANIACNALTPSGLNSVELDGTVTRISTKSQGDFMKGYAATVNGVEGYYASGRLAASPGTVYYFAVEMPAGDKYDFYKKTESAISDNAAIKLAHLHQVGSGYYSVGTLAGKYWATVNVGADRPWTYTETQKTWTNAVNDLSGEEALPSYSDANGLIMNCINTAITIGGVIGTLSVDNTMPTSTGGYIFLPFSGQQGGSYAGTLMAYWAESKDDDNAYYFDSIHISYADKTSYQISTRPIQK